MFIAVNAEPVSHWPTASMNQLRLSAAFRVVGQVLPERPTEVRVVEIGPVAADGLDDHRVVHGVAVVGERLVPVRVPHREQQAGDDDGDEPDHARLDGEDAQANGWRPLVRHPRRTLVSGPRRRRAPVRCLGSPTATGYAQRPRAPRLPSAMADTDPPALDAFRGASCLVTGGLGFIGSNLALGPRRRRRARRRDRRPRARARRRPPQPRRRRPPTSPSPSPASATATPSRRCCATPTSSSTWPDR